MALPGTGIQPLGAAAAELTAITRRAFVHRIPVQIYNSSPWFAALIANAQVASGGLSPITQPVQGAKMTTHSWGDYGASFNMPAQQNGIQDAEYALKLSMVPIPFLGMEAAVQVDYAVVPRIEAVMNDAGNNASDAMATALYSNTTNAQAFNGIAGLIDDGTNLTTSYGSTLTPHPVAPGTVKIAFTDTNSGNIVYLRDDGYGHLYYSHIVPDVNHWSGTINYTTGVFSFSTFISAGPTFVPGWTGSTSVTYNCATGTGNITIDYKTSLSAPIDKIELWSASAVMVTLTPPPLYFLKTENHLSVELQIAL